MYAGAGSLQPTVVTAVGPRWQARRERCRCKASLGWNGQERGREANASPGCWRNERWGMTTDWRGEMRGVATA